MSCEELSQGGESCDSDRSELISRESILSSFMYQQLPRDIIISLLADELEDMGSEEDRSWDEFRDMQEDSEEPSDGERQNIPIDVLFAFVDFDEEK